MHHGSQRLMILLLTLAWLTSPATLSVLLRVLMVAVALIGVGWILKKRR